MLNLKLDNNRVGREWLVNSGLLLALLALCMHLHGAATINFQSTPFENDLQSDDTPMDSTFSFQLGTFDTSGGWTPNSTNTAEWVNRWIAAPLVDGTTGNPITGDFVSYNDSELFPGFNINNVEGSALVEDNSSIAAGSQGYIWGYTNRDGSEAEWILLTNSGWSFPDTTLNDGLPTTQNWEVGDNNTFALLGDVDNTDSEIHETQSAAVPEPSSAVLLLASIGALCMRRRKS